MHSFSDQCQEHPMTFALKMFWVETKACLLCACSITHRNTSCLFIHSQNSYFAGSSPIPCYLKLLGRKNIRVDISWDNLLLRNKIRVSERILMLKANWEISAPELVKGLLYPKLTMFSWHTKQKISHNHLPVPWQQKREREKNMLLSGHLKFADPECDSACKIKMHGVVCGDLCCWFFLSLRQIEFETWEGGWCNFKKIKTKIKLAVTK